MEIKSYKSKKMNTYESLEEYELLGINKSGDHQTTCLLVMEKLDKLIIRETKQSDGSRRYFADQSTNVNSIVIWPGGIYEGNCFICGHIGTIHAEESKKLFSAFQKSIRKRCKLKVGSYYISDEAKESYSHMRFITVNINQPKEYDLKI